MRESDLRSVRAQAHADVETFEAGYAHTPYHTAREAAFDYADGHDYTGTTREEYVMYFIRVWNDHRHDGHCTHT